MSPRVGVYVCTRGVSGVQYRFSGSGVEVLRSFDVPARIESSREAAEQVTGALSDAGIRHADVTLTLRGLGTSHHVLDVPAVGDELLTPIVDREIRRIEPELGAVRISWLPLPRDPDEIEHGPPQRQVLAAAAPLALIETMDAALRDAGHRLTHVTVLAAAIHQLQAEFLDSAEPTALVAPLRDGAFLGFFVGGAMQLAVEPPLAPDDHHDAAAIAEELELGILFVRQQFRNAQVSRLVICGPADSFPDAESAFSQRLGIAAQRLALGDLSSGALVALGGALDARSSSGLALAAEPGSHASAPRGALKAASIVAVVAAAAIGAYALFAIYKNRDAETKRRSAQERSPQESLTSTREAADRRKLIDDAAQLLRLVDDDRLALRNGLVALAGAVAAPVQFDSMRLTHAAAGWNALVSGTVRGESSARSVELLHQFYRDLPNRMSVRDLALEQLNFGAGGVAGTAARFRLSFVIPRPRVSPATTSDSTRVWRELRSLGTVGDDRSGATQRVVRAAESAGLKDVKVSVAPPDTDSPAARLSAGGVSRRATSYSLTVEGRGGLAAMIGFLGQLPPSISATRLSMAREPGSARHRVSLAVYELTFENGPPPDFTSSTVAGSAPMTPSVQARVDLPSDPFAPSGGNSVASLRNSSTVSKGSGTAPRALTAVLVGAKPVAVIDDEVVSVGDVLRGGARVARIQSDRVFLIEKNGKWRTLTLAEGRPQQ